MRHKNPWWRYDGRMRYRSIDVGRDRFLMHIRTSGWQEDNEFKQWMIDNYPECMCVKRDHYGTDPYWEVRGGDTTIPITIKLTWG